MGANTVTSFNNPVGPDFFLAYGKTIYIHPVSRRAWTWVSIHHPGKDLWSWQGSESDTAEAFANSLEAQGFLMGFE